MLRGLKSTQENTQSPKKQRAGYKAEIPADDCVSSGYTEKYSISVGVAISLYLRENSLTLRFLLPASSAMANLFPCFEIPSGVSSGKDT